LIIGYLDRITNEKDEKSKEKIGKIVLLEFVKDNPIYIQYGNAPEMFIVADVLSINGQKLLRCVSMDNTILHIPASYLDRKDNVITLTYKTVYDDTTGISSDKLVGMTTK
jgi:hypothetical protein